MFIVGLWRSGLFGPSWRCRQPPKKCALFFGRELHYRRSKRQEAGRAAQGSNAVHRVWSLSDRARARRCAFALGDASGVQEGQVGKGAFNLSRARRVASRYTRGACVGMLIACPHHLVDDGVPWIRGSHLSNTTTCLTLLV